MFVCPLVQIYVGLTTLGDEKRGEFMEESEKKALTWSLGRG